MNNEIIKNLRETIERHIATSELNSRLSFRITEELFPLGTRVFPKKLDGEETALGATVQRIGGFTNGHPAVIAIVDGEAQSRAFRLHEIKLKGEA